ncbi:MAG TPA: hypothetical protein QF753_19725 [Victivallales bacterium]|nr:hypothetical protein [Victivallales bacterium]
MKIIKFLLTVVLILASSVSFAQIGMKLALNNKSYLKYEKIYAKVTLMNQAGHPIVFGLNPKLNGNIKFEIETISGKTPVPLNNNYKVEGKVISPGEKEEFIIPLTSIYNFPNVGRYKIKAIVEHSNFTASYQSNSIYFQIAKGHVVWSTTVGVPTSKVPENGNIIDKRKYVILRYFDGKDKIYCLKVEDDKYVYGVTKLGVDIGTQKPECKIDRFSRLHILVQTSSKIYSYFVYDINCQLEEKAVYRKFIESVPMLTENKKLGKIEVFGGIEAQEGRHYLEYNEAPY